MTKILSFLEIGAEEYDRLCENAMRCFRPYGENCEVLYYEDGTAVEVRFY